MSVLVIFSWEQSICLSLPLCGPLDPYSMPDLITFTFKQTLSARSAMSSDREVGVRQLGKKTDRKMYVIVSFLN